MDDRKQQVEAREPEVLEEGQAVTDELMACCKAGANNARM